MNFNQIRRTVFVLCTIQIFFSSFGDHFTGKRGQSLFAATPIQILTIQAGEKPPIQWFKEEMKISPKYQEKKEGILGISWFHFLTMAFLAAFFFGALLVYYLKTVKTQRILEKLLKEEEENKGPIG